MTASIYSTSMSNKKKYSGLDEMSAFTPLYVTTF